MNPLDFYDAIKKDESDRIFNVYIKPKKIILNEINYLGTTPLLTAVTNRRYNIVSLLVTAGANINQFVTKDTEKRLITNPLLSAIELESAKMVSLLIKLGALIEVKNSCGETALMIAAKIGHLTIINKLLISGSNPFETLNNNTSAYTLATKNGQLGCAELIKAFMIQKACEYGIPLIMLAAKIGDYDRFIELQGSCSNIKHLALYNCALEGNNPRIIAKVVELIVLNGYAEIVQTISLNPLETLEHFLSNSHIETNNAHYNGILSESLKHYNVEVHALLLKKITDKTLYNQQLFLAHRYGLENNKTDFCNALFNRSSNEELGVYQNSDGNNLLLWATYYNNSQMVKRFLEITNVNTANNSMQTPLALAIEKEHWQLIPILQNHGASFKTQIPLFFSTLKKKEIAISLLLAQNNPEHLLCNDEQNNSALHVMATQSDTNTADKISLLTLLLQAGLDIDAQNKEGNTPLMLAIQNTNEIMVCALVLAGGKMDVSNNKNETGSSLAVSQGMDNKIVQWFNFGIFRCQGPQSSQDEELPDLFENINYYIQK